MKTLFKVLVGAVAGIVAMLGVANAQSSPGTTTTQTAYHADACTAAGQSHSSAATITITPPGGSYVYICGVDIENCAGASAVTAAAETFVTTTNLTGSPQWMIGSGTTAGACQPPAHYSFAPGSVKSAQIGTAVTFVLPTFATNQTVNVNVWYYTNPF